jgi:hypothetical protein
MTSFPGGLEAGRTMLQDSNPPGEHASFFGHLIAHVFQRRFALALVWASRAVSNGDMPNLTAEAWALPFPFDGFEPTDVTQRFSP